MTEHQETQAGRTLAHDLEALRAVTARDVPRLQDTASALERRAAHDTREGWLMKSMRWMKARPLFTTAAATAVAAAVLLLVPISYQRTVGQDVTLSLSGAIDSGALHTIAKELKTAVGASAVQVSQVDAGHGMTTELHAQSGSRSGAAMKAKSAAFAKALGERGIQAVAQVTPRTERVSTNLYAYAADQVVTLRIDSAGKTPEELEADIRAQLAAAGLPDASVSVTQDGDRRQVQVTAHSDDSTPEGEEHRAFNIQLNGPGDQPMEAQMHQFNVERTPGMTDADVKAEIERQMREAGLNGTVTVENGRIEVQVQHEESATPPSGARSAPGAGTQTEQRTWGAVKSEVHH